MNNNLIGITLSALLHLGMYSWASGVSNKPVKENFIVEKTVLNVSTFQAEKINRPVVSLPPIIEPVIEKAKVIEKLTPPVIEKKVEAEVEILPEKQPQKPTASLIIEKKSVVKPKRKKLIKLAKKKPIIIKKHKKVLAKKLRKQIKKKPKIKRIIKKPFKRKITKKQTLYKKKLKPSKKVVAIKKRAQAISTPRKRPVARKYKKLGGVSNKKRLQHSQLTKKASPNGATQTAFNKKVTAQYKARLQRLIASKKRYPKRAKRRGHQGRVTVSFKVIHSGIISEIKIIKAAKNKDLNRASINAIKQSSGKLLYPRGMSKRALTLRITLSYILK